MNRNEWPVYELEIIVSAGPALQMLVFPNVLLAVFALFLEIVMILFSMETPDYQKLMETMDELEWTGREKSELPLNLFLEWMRCFFEKKRWKT